METMITKQSAHTVTSKYYKMKQRFSALMVYIILILICMICVYPVFWIFVGSLNPGDTLYSTSVFPEKLSFLHYKELFQKTNFANWYKNTLFICFMTMILATFMTVNTAYAFSRFRFKGHKSGLITMLILQMFPPFMGMIAIYILLLQLNLLDNFWGLILVYVGTFVPYNTWLMKGYFDGLSKSIEDAAKIDGASHLKIFLKITLPLSKPMITFIAINSFILPWMDFVLASLVLRSSEQKTLAIGLYEMVKGKTDVDFTTFAAGAVLVAIPITFLFLTFQKWMIEGISAGAEKG